MPIFNRPICCCRDPLIGCITLRVARSCPAYYCIQSVLNTFSYKVQEEAGRQAYYVDGLEYKTYANSLQNTLYLWCPTSEKFHDWPQLVSMGLMSKWRWA